MEEKKDAKKYAQQEAQKLRAQVENKPQTHTQQRQTQLSYEQLNEIAHQLSDQNMQLRRQVQSMDLSNFFKRLDYLFNVLRYAHMFSDEFTDSCVREIEASLKIPDKQESSEEGSAEQEESKEDLEEQEDDLEGSEDEELEGIHP